MLPKPHWDGDFGPDFAFTRLGCDEQFLELAQAGRSHSRDVTAAEIDTRTWNKETIGREWTGPVPIANDAESCFEQCPVSVMRTPINRSFETSLSNGYAHRRNDRKLFAET
ncbi:hypothetical protein K426_11440 [Sphingobium sp. TKS]|nr:hypothetical protein K426_11440 [Sphingobium sp. TKS]